MKKRKSIKRLLTVAVFFLVVSMGRRDSHAAAEKTVYVDASANAGGDGSISKPFSSIQTAVNSLEEGAGGNVLLREGIYKEKVVMKRNGSKQVPITITTYNKEKAIIDGDGSNGVLLQLNEKSNLVIDGLVFRNMVGTTSGVAIAIMGIGNEDNITIQNCEIYEINTKDPTTCNADAISIRAAAGKSSNISILNNNIHDCETGWSEAVVLNGYVDGAVIKGNTIRNIGNIGIDIAGHYGVYKDPAHDQAKNVLIAENIIDQCVSPNCLSAAGIYCDGGSNVTIQDNIVTNCQVGIGIGCEEADKGYPVTEIIVHNNVVYGTRYSAFDIGGYSSKSGIVQQAVVTNNTFYTNNASNSAIRFSKTKNAHFEKNLIVTPKRAIMSYDVSLSNISNVTFTDNMFSSDYSEVSDVSLYVSGVSNNAVFTQYIENFTYLPIWKVQLTACFDNTTEYGYQSIVKEPETGDTEETPEPDEEQKPDEGIVSSTLLFDSFTPGKLVKSASEDGFILNATAKKTMEVTMGVYKAADGSQFTSKLRFNGAGSVTTRNIQFTAAKEQRTVTVYASNTSTSGNLQLVNELGEVVQSVAIGNEIKSYTFTDLTEGKYYLVADGGNMTAYSVRIS
ncbi:MAG: right-handed parallel beta-helix repeat-containing protein [bacterium]|nr:right-handed parallel beta-helix repeat-containing protein [bacterium]